MKTLLLASVFASFLASNPLNVSSTNTPSQADWFRFIVQPGTPGQVLERPLVSAKGGAGNITVRTDLSASTPCQKLSGAAERKGKKVTVRVTIRPRETGGCILMVGNFRYEANLNKLTPGKYQVEVIHEYPNSGWLSETVFKRQVSVR
ncbi:hypothetical protein H6F78_05105 [Coleofasciculus sp. FACHB-64]|uniref:hypothetical protein n=1 Tax=Cyanophyceae TaxID=3028117 RepID=UPI0016826ABD|nr:MULTISPECIES: hypothetical protein [unclassified Coleofasciculus]MBD1880712.1 hypothetical protein [Coleofasciculus sp. FACHB-T130]MBD2045014.1 hypothetical protein [Coleofasciculus sp. FACHB-64]